MSYPQITDFQDAVQNPGSAFSDPQLQRGSVKENGLGLPIALSGGFALTYTVENSGKKFAVRCFHREVPEAQNRYSAISQKLRALNSSYFVNFDFQPQGVRIRGKGYPIVKMDWVEGNTLGVHLDQFASRSAALTSLRMQFQRLQEYLEKNGIAHGDIQNDNVMVVGNDLRLIDYDGVFVHGMTEGRGAEVGHKHFQHPSRRASDFGPKMDRFSFILIDVSLQALIADSTLHKRFREGGQAIIFKANDLVDPRSSEIFSVLQRMPAVSESAKRFEAICGASLSDIPTLADFIAGRNIPAARASSATQAKPAAAAPVYIGAFEVLAGDNFSGVLSKVGDKIEIVGEIISVKEGIGRRGRGRGRPYIFINFGAWNKESVKVTIWSDGLSNLSNRPSKAWEGKWISVTGLVEPPYEGKHYGRPYTNVGVTVDSDNQIVHLSAKDAQFRLKKGSSPTATSRPRAGTVERTRTGNSKILEDIRAGSIPHQPSTVRFPFGNAPQPPQTPAQAASSRNQQILQNMGQQQVPQRYQTSTQSQNTPRYSQNRSQSGIPGWVWFVGIIVLIFIFANVGGKRR